MNRSPLSLVALCALCVASPLAHAQSSASPAPRMIMPPPRPATAIPGLQLAWSIGPASARLDSHYTAATLSSSAPVGTNGFPAPNVPITITLRMHNDTAATIDVGDDTWQLTLAGPGALSLTNRSGCLVTANVRPARVIHVPAHGDAVMTLEGLTTGGTCPVSAWFYTAPGHYTVEGTVRTRYIAGGGPNISRGTAVVLTIPRLAFDITP